MDRERNDKVIPKLIVQATQVFNITSICFLVDVIYPVGKLLGCVINIPKETESQSSVWVPSVCMVKGKLSSTRRMN